MLIDFTTAITNLDGEAIKDGSGEMTLREVAISALVSTLAEPGGHAEVLQPMEKVGNARLAQTIHGADTVDLTAEQVALLKSRIGRAYAPVVVMRAWDILDPTA